MNKLQNRRKRFKEWKQQPHQVAPLSEEQHECATCGNFKKEKLVTMMVFKRKCLTLEQENLK